MSIDILSHTKEIGTKTEGSKDILQKNNSKKEGGGLFDSMMRSIQGKNEESSSKNTTDQKDKLSKTAQTKDTKDTKVTLVATKSIDPEASKKVSEQLVDLVVDKAKKSTQEVEEGLEKKIATTTLEEEAEEAVKKTPLSQKIINTSESTVDQTTKSKIENSTSQIQKAVTNIEKEILKENKETQKETQKGTLEKTKQETLQGDIKKDLTAISNAASDIKKEIVNFDQEEKKNSIDLTLKKVVEKSVEDEKDTLKETSKEQLKEKVEQSVTIIQQKTSSVEEKIVEVISQKVVTQRGEEKEKTQEKVDTHISLIKKATQEIAQELETPQETKDPKVVTKVETLLTDTPKEVQTPKLVQTQDSIDPKKPQNETFVDGKTELLANRFFNDQQRSRQVTSMAQLANAKENIEKNKSLGSVKESGKMLDLDPKDLQVEHSGEDKKVEKIDILARKETQTQLQMFQNGGLNRVLLQKETLNAQVKLQSNKELEAANTQESQAKQEKSITLQVPQTVVETIQSKIIGAQQKVGGFMSEVARNMYLNYKPPFTAFRMNLNPENLGNIAVVMRANKADNSISVSMNMNNSATMEAFAENKAALQTALQRQLGESSNVALSFNMQENNSQGQFDQSNHNNNQENNNNTDRSSEKPTKTTIEEEDTEELDYM